MRVSKNSGLLALLLGSSVVLATSSSPVAAQGYQWNLQLTPTVGGHIETLIEAPSLFEYEINILGLYHYYTFRWVDWYSVGYGLGTSTCSSASPVNCSFTLPDWIERIDVPIETDALGDLVTLPVYKPARRVTFTAVPDPGWYFHGWNSPVCPDEWPTALGMFGFQGKMMSCHPAFPIDATISPYFSQCPPGASCITVQASPKQIGTVQLRAGDANGPVVHSCDSFCTFQVLPGSSWTLTPTSALGAVLSDWHGCDAAPGNASCSLPNVLGETRVGGKFKYPLVVTNSSQFVTVWVDQDKAYLGGCDSTASPCTFLLDVGSKAKLTQRVNPPQIGSYRFTRGWQGCTPKDYGSGTVDYTAFCEATMTGPKAAQSVYSDEWHFVVDRAEHGRIVSNPPGIDCGTTTNLCDTWFPVYSTVNFTATPDAGYIFRFWDDGRVGYPGGDCVGAGESPNCSVFLNHQPSLTGASFYPMLNVQVGAGGFVTPTVLSSTSPYDNGTPCPATLPNLCLAVPPGSRVGLVASNFSGYTFSTWGGECFGGITQPCEPIVDAPRNVTAAFTGTHRLLLGTGPSGKVSVTSSVSPLVCHYGCPQSNPTFGGSSVEYNTGTTVNLAVLPPITGYESWVFVGWSGACSGKSANCSLLTGTQLVDGSGNTVVNASFAPGVMTNVWTHGPGNVTSDTPAVPFCSGSCNQYMAEGLYTTLTAHPAPGATFVGWGTPWGGPGCNGTGTCTPLNYGPPLNGTIHAYFVSGHAELSSLTLSDGTLAPGFSSEVTSYTASVGHATSSLVVTPVAYDGAATRQVRVNGGAWETVPFGYWSSPLPLNVGSNLLEVFLTAEDGVTTRTYTVTVNRAAAAPAEVDADFAESNPSGSIQALSVQPDGKLVVGGGFIIIGGQLRFGVARLNGDGTLDSSFDANVDTFVYDTAIQPDGKIVLGGIFGSVGGQPRSRVARVNQDSSLDLSFAPSVTGATVLSLAVQPDGKILIAGAFTEVDGLPRSNIARLNADGSVDSAFDAGSLDGIVNSVALQPDGKVLIGGEFTTAGGQTRHYIARLNLDGMADGAFNPDADGYVDTIAVQPDGKILLSGTFGAVGGGTRPALARLLPNGTLDPSFSGDAQVIANSIALQTDGKIILGGTFADVGGVPRNNIARLNPDGTLDGFNPNADNVVQALAVQEDGKVIVTGDFGSIGGVPRNKIARIGNDAATESLTVDNASSVTWLRGGASPESQHVSFELSTDGGTTYTPLPAGTRTASGWQLNGLALPSSGQVRARARTGSGRFDGSSGLVDTVVPFTDLPDPQADLSVTKTDGVSTYTPGSTLTYTVTVSNAGPAGVTGATVTDAFLSVFSCSTTCVGTGGATCTAGPFTGDIYDTVNIPLGQSVTYTSVCNVSASASGPIFNSATVSAPAGIDDPNPGNNEAADVDNFVPTLSVGDVSVTEGNSGTKTATFTVTLSTAYGAEVTVNYATENVTATAGSDYVAASGTLTFSPGATSQPIPVTVNGDSAYEADETFRVVLSNPTLATIGDAEGVATIANDDAPPGPSRVFVSVTGVDTNDCSNVATPCRTLNAAISQVAEHGQVIMTKSGSYAGAMVTKSVKLDAASGIVAFSGQPITVNSGPGTTVVIRGLTLKSLTQGSGSGIVIQSAGAVLVESSVIDGWNVGIDQTGAAEVFVKDSMLRNNTTGLRVAAGKATIDNTRFANNSTGIAADAGHVSVRGSTLAGNVSAGIAAIGGSSVTVERSQIAHNATGVALPTASGATVRLSRCVVSGNAVGLMNDGGTLEVSGTNVVRGNGTNTTGTITTTSLQ